MSDNETAFEISVLSGKRDREPGDIIAEMIRMSYCFGIQETRRCHLRVSTGNADAVCVKEIPQPHRALVMPSERPIFWQPIGEPIPPGAEWVGSVWPDADGTLHFDLPRIRSVGIADVSQVVEHRIVSAVGSVSHHVRFHNGGEVWFVFNDRNELVDLKAHAFGVLVTPEGDCIFREFEPLAGQLLPSA